MKVLLIGAEGYPHRCRKGASSVPKFKTSLIMPYTLHIHIKPLLAEYLYGRYSDFIEEGALHLPAGCYLYITLQELLGRRPASAPLRETGNLCLRLTAPHRGKNPAY